MCLFLRFWSYWACSYWWIPCRSLTHTETMEMEVDFLEVEVDITASMDILKVDSVHWGMYWQSLLVDWFMEAEVDSVVCFLDSKIPWTVLRKMMWREERLIKHAGILDTRDIGKRKVFVFVDNIIVRLIIQISYFISEWSLFIYYIVCIYLWKCYIHQKLIHVVYCTI